MIDEPELAAGWTKADWEHYRLLSLALSLEAERGRIGDLLFERRCEQGFTRGQLARLTGMRAKDIKRIEKGRGDPPLSLLHGLFEVLGIAARYSAL